LISLLSLHHWSLSPKAALSLLSARNPIQRIWWA
jgi:hypothetical protein